MEKLMYILFGVVMGATGYILFINDAPPSKTAYTVEHIAKPMVLVGREDHCDPTTGLPKIRHCESELDEDCFDGQYCVADWRGVGGICVGPIYSNKLKREMEGSLHQIGH